MTKKRNLVRMVFLELEKYHNTDIQHYRKVRWIEFFGNKPYTQNPENNTENKQIKSLTQSDGQRRRKP